MSEFKQFCAEHGVVIKAQVLKNYGTMSGIFAKVTKKTYIDMNEEKAWKEGPDQGNGTSFPGIYTWFPATQKALAAANAIDSTGPDSTLLEKVNATDLANDYLKYAVYALYIGMSDNILDRVLSPANGKPDGHGVGRFMYYNDLVKNDLQVLVMTVANAETGELLGGKKLKDFEQLLHIYNESKIKVRFLLHGYSGVHGEHGSDMADVMSIITKAGDEKLNAIAVKLFRRRIELWTDSINDEIELALSEYQTSAEVED
tara:strand:- start:3081 stop:3854 length:774 start_codon:yes stop_codon:yes gene_type:complete